DAGGTFDRAFTLSGSPTGRWRVTLFGHLIGSLFTFGAADVHPRAQVSGSITLFDANNNEVDKLVWGEFIIDMQASRDIDQAQQTTQSLLESRSPYTVHGELTTTATIDGTLASPGPQANANFFSNPVPPPPNSLPVGLTAFVEATPVPEPSTLLLLA